MALLTELLSAVGSAGTLTWALLAFTLPLLSFRVWAFTIKPLLNPKEPLELPYWIPFLGHAIEFVKNGNKVITRARARFDPLEPFALTVGGQKIYFVTLPESVSAFYKNSTSLSLDKVVHDVTMTFGVSKASTDKFYEPPTCEEDNVAARAAGIPNPDLKCLAKLNMIMWKEQLVPGPTYYELQNVFFDLLDTALRPENLTGRYVRSPDKKKDSSITVSLLDLTEELLIDAALKAFFGRKLQELNPDLITDSMNFDRESWKLWYKWPNAGDMERAKARMLATVQQWLTLSKEDRKGACYLVEQFIATERAVGFPEKDIAEMLCIVIFATNTNTYKGCFWALAHLLEQPDLIASLRAGEVASAMALEKTARLEFLADSCPILNSVFMEALRVYANSHSVRITTAPTQIGTKIIPKDARVMVPYRQMHMNDDVWEYARGFDPERFSRNPKALRSSSLRPFGGGISYCPGRFIAKAEVLIFISLLLDRYEISKVANSRFPEADLGTPVAGLVSPLAGEDVLVKLTPRY